MRIQKGVALWKTGGEVEQNGGSRGRVLLQGLRMGWTQSRGRKRPIVSLPLAPFRIFNDSLFTNNNKSNNSSRRRRRFNGMEEISYPPLLRQILQGSQAFIKFPLRIFFCGFSFIFLYGLYWVFGCRESSGSVSKPKVNWWVFFILFCFVFDCIYSKLVLILNFSKASHFLRDY